MLFVVKQVDDQTIEALFSIYAESMGELAAQFESKEEMKAAYADFVRAFVADPKQRLFVEEDGGVWKSALRAVAMSEQSWFFEAVETMPEARRKGYGAALLRHSIAYLKDMGVREVACTIFKGNDKSRALHEGCGFAATDEPPVNAWGETEDGCILYRYPMTA